MPKQYLKHPRTITDLSKLVLRCRISLGETQAEFAKRFSVTKTTLCNWETGKTQFIQKIHRQILDALKGRLQADGRLIPVEILTPIYREAIEAYGNAAK